MQEPRFVGESRELLVDGLLGLFEEVASSGEPRWVSLEAPSGWGKTRVVQEFYRRLSASQSDPKYWPETILNAEDTHLEDTHREGAAFVAYRRKRVYPQGQIRVAGSLPDFMWWGIACSNRNGVPSSALAEDLRQLDHHSPFLEARWQTLVSFKGRNADVLREWRASIVEEGAVEAANRLLELAGGEVPGLGLAWKGLRWLRDRRSQERATWEAINKASIIGVDTAVDIVDDIAIDLRRLSTHIPIVVFVEDFHLADPLLIDLVVSLVTGSGKILVITSCWPGHIEQTAPALLSNTLSERSVRVEHDQPRDSRLPSGAGLSELAAEALQSVVRAYFPNATPQTATALVQHYPNPLGVELACIGEGGPSDEVLDLTPDQIAQLPTEVKDQYLRLWLQLPAVLRAALVLAAWSTPTEIDRNSPDARWDNPLTIQAITSMAIEEADELTIALTSTADAYGWVRTADEAGILWLFHEPAMRQIAVDNPPAPYLRKRPQWMETLSRLVAGSGNDELSSHRADLVIALHAKDLLATSDLILSAYLTRIRGLLDTPRQYAELISVGDRATNIATDDLTDHPITLTIRAHTAWARAQVGPVNEAIAEFEGVLADRRRVLGDDHPNTLTSRNNLAGAYETAGRVNEAIAEFEGVLADRRRVLGDDHPDTLMSRNNLAGAYETAGRVKEAINLYEGVLADLRRVLGDDHPNTLTIRNNLAYAYETAGRVKEALSLYEEVLADLRRVLGDDHTNTLMSRNNLAYAYRTAGRVEEALSLYQGVLADRRRVLGDDHPDTLTSRNNLAYAYETAGRVKEAIAEFEGVLADLRRVLGDDHPNTLISRNNLAGAYETAGRVEEAIAEFEGVLADRRRVLGDDHPDTLMSRNNLACAYRTAGRVEEAIAEFKGVLADRRRVLGDDHPNTLTSRNNLAGAYETAGRVEEAISLYKGVLADRRRVLGDDHPDTLNSRNNLAIAYRTAGRVEEALRTVKQD